jgi:hypothetical protein
MYWSPRILTLRRSGKDARKSSSATLQACFSVGRIFSSIRIFIQVPACSSLTKETVTVELSAYLLPGA